MKNIILSPHKSPDIRLEMAGWAGFSDEELRRLQQKEQAVPAALGRGRRPAPTNRSRQQLQRERAMQLAAQQRSGPGMPALPPGQQLSMPPPPSASTQAAPIKPVEPKKEADAVTVNHDPSPPEEKEDMPPIAKELEKQEVEIREKSRIEQLQQDQTEMEQKNKLKKALLAKTIAEKSKQTQAEVVKLKRIQKELQALDDMVSNDIGILRGRIEQASWDYAAARKRFDKVEVEYVTAKMDLHRKTEVKEQLTEHLCAIIQQNELRKAHKLEELMQQLQLQATEEEPEEERKEKEEEEERGVSATENQGEGNGEEPVDEASGAGTQTDTHVGGATVQKDCPPAVTEPQTGVQDCKMADGAAAVGQSEAPASAS